MNKDEIIEKLIEKDVIAVISGNYFITTKIEDLLNEKRLPEPEKSVNKNNKAISNNKVTSDWPVIIALQKDRDQAIAIMNYCDVPYYSKSDEKYRIRTLATSSMKLVTKMVCHCDSELSIRIIKDYYTKTSSPKNFNNFMNTLFFDLYDEYTNGMFIPDSVSEDNADKSNQTFG